MITIKKESEIKILREGGKILSDLLQFLAGIAKPGVSTKYLEEIARKKIEEAGATPAFLNYTPKGAERPFPAALCVSVNDVVVHGIPNEKPRILKEGDIVTIDTGLCYKGLYTDSAISVGVGEIDASAKKLLKATHEALMAAIDAAVPGAKTIDIGIAIEKVAKKYKFSPAEDLGGHGVGYSQHEDPFIPNFRMKGGVELKAGMVLAIEPMLNEGKSGVRFLQDGYTVVTADGKRSAHFEHTVVVTKEGAEILT
ncbi:MAG: type I methionyl aminopeptidase [Candidatus Paceibacterota bacterium]|jgi:methionyl aminopeptidase